MKILTKFEPNEDVFMMQNNCIVKVIIDRIVIKVNSNHLTTFETKIEYVLKPHLLGSNVLTVPEEVLFESKEALVEKLLNP